MVPPNQPAEGAEGSFERLVKLVAHLRSEEGCPWDRDQTMESMREHLVEETEEVLEALDRGDMDNLREELGDLLLQVVFYAQMARERDLFDVEEVLAGLNAKLVRRHPHVFGDGDAATPGEAIDRWREAKEAE